MLIGPNIRELRRKKNLTQYELAQAVSKDVSTISKIETNKAKPSIQTLKLIAEALETTMSELINEKA